MKQKKLMLLGGLRYLLPVIDAAHKQGYYVITADYLPNSIAHKYSDEYVNVSVIDKEAVLKAAQNRQIDGIMSFACDPGVIAASYVQNQMRLPSFGPYESVAILQNKDKFRAFLAANSFNVPWAYGFGSVDEAWTERDMFTYPLIVKPTDSAGSKGCTRVDSAEKLLVALKYAYEHSIHGRIIVEEFIEKKGCSSDSDCFVQDGMLKFVSYSSQRFDDNALNPYAPAAFSWPSTFTADEEAYLTAELQRLISLLHMNTAVFNVETRVGVNGKPYIMEFSPRGGGNRLCEMLRYASGTDLITAITRAVVGDMPSDDMKSSYVGHWVEVILHADSDGEFGGLRLAPNMRSHVVEEDLWVKPGDSVQGFSGANQTIGTLVLRFDSSEEAEEALATLRHWCEIVIVSRPPQRVICE